MLALILVPAYADRPNVLLIAIDDLNDWVGCLEGHVQARTPHIDALAARGTLFTNAHCQAPICNPSRTSVMLGRRPSTSGIYMNRPWFRTTALHRHAVTLPQYFSHHGYKTLTTGKIFHGSRVDPASFQVVGPRPGQRRPQDKQIVKISDSQSRLWDFGPQSYAEDEFGDAITTRWAIEQLSAKHDRPFFLAVGLYRPHVPWYAPPRFFESRPIADVVLPQVRVDDREDLPAAAIALTENSTPPSHQWFVQNDQWSPAVQAFLASSSFTDEQVGRLLRSLDHSDYSDNTIVVLFSDHGFHLGEKQRWAKQSLWERSTRVPFIIRLPAQTDSHTCRQPVELLSIYPTLIDLCGLPPRDDLEGVSVRPLLNDPETQWPYPAITTYGQNNHAVRSNRWRYIRYADGSQELYDHRKDPREWDNLLDDDDAIPSDVDLESVVAQHRRWLPEVNVAPQREVNAEKQSIGVRAVSIALREREFWKNGKRRERDPEVAKRLQAYWKATGLDFEAESFQETAFQSKWPWSSAFISWVMKRAGAGEHFEYSASHWRYVAAAKKHRVENTDSPIKAFSIEERAVEVGDIVVKRRSDSVANYDNIERGHKTHGDLVVEIRDRTAVTIGGNVGNSVRTTMVNLDEQGKVADEAYFAIVKVGSEP